MSKIRINRFGDTFCTEEGRCEFIGETAAQVLLMLQEHCLAMISRYANEELLVSKYAKIAKDANEDLRDILYNQTPQSSAPSIKGESNSPEKSFRASITEISRRIIADSHIPDFMFCRCKATYIMEDMEECIEYLMEEYKKCPDVKLIVGFAYSVAYDALLLLLQRHHAADPIRNIPAFSMAIMSRIVSLLVKKNHDYGNSFGDQLAEDGPIVFKIRMKDKISRLKTLLAPVSSSEAAPQSKVKDESIEDTLRDIIGYCILFLHHTAN